MTVLHVPFCFHPDPMGGTEVYVAALAQRLQARGARAVIAAPGDADREYSHEGVRVRRFAVQTRVRDLRALYGGGDDVASAGFARILDEERPDLVHLHALTSAISLGLVRAAKARKLPVVFTYHTPTASCQRGTMMRWGEDPCDGLMTAHRCSACTLHGLRRKSPLGKIAAMLGGAIPIWFGRWLGNRGLQGGIWTALRMTELVALRQANTRALFAEVDAIVAVCDWVKRVLLRNGVPEAKITLCRQGVSTGEAEGSGEREAGAEVGSQSSAVRGPSSLAPPISNLRSPISSRRICFLGRLDPTKGVDTLIQAVRALPDAPLVLDIYGIAQGEAGQAYAENLRRLALGDQRIRFCVPVPPGEIVGTLRKYDVLAVPSRCLETGPLVVLEAFAAGRPVLGSRLGGIAELVREGVDGWLVAGGRVSEWAEALRDLSNHRERLERLRGGGQPPRSMPEVAEDMAAVYVRLMDKKPLSVL